jgi:hypothetical protein
VIVVIVVGNFVLFVEFLVQSRQNHLFPQGSVEQPDKDYVLNYGPAQLGHDVGWVGEDAPGFFPNIHVYSFFGVLACHFDFHDANLGLLIMKVNSSSGFC